MQRGEITAKLDAVPVFSVVQRETQEVVPTAMEQGTLCCTFHLDVAEAQQALEAAQQANPALQLELSATPLGTAFALCEWQQQLFPGGDGGDAGDDDNDGFDSLGQDIASASADPPGDFDDELEDAAAPREVRAELRLKALETEVECATPLLAEAPVPPLLVRRNRLVGAVPLFGTDAIRFTANEGADADSTLQPLFFTRDHVRAAWAASGGASEKMPPMQVTDLRTLVWQMQYDFSQDWRSLLFVVRAQQPGRRSVAPRLSHPICCSSFSCAGAAELDRVHRVRGRGRGASAAGAAARALASGHPRADIRGRWWPKVKGLLKFAAPDAWGDHHRTRGQLSVFRMLPRARCRLWCVLRRERAVCREAPSDVVN